MVILVGGRSSLFRLPSASIIVTIGTVEGHVVIVGTRWAGARVCAQGRGGVGKVKLGDGLRVGTHVVGLCFGEDARVDGLGIDDRKLFL